MKIFTSLLLLLFSYPGFQQDKTITKAQSLIYQGYIENDPGSWESGISILEQASKTSPKNQELTYQLCLGYYGQIGSCRNSAGCTDLGEKIERAQALVSKKLINKNETSSSYAALMGGLLAMEIEEKPAQMIFLGPKCSNFINKSISLDSENPLAWVEKGNLYFHSPALFGGDMNKAISSFQKALRLFDKYPSLKSKSWQYLHAWAWLGLAYQEQGRDAEAKSTFEKVLRIEPGFLWVRKELLPALNK